MLKSVKLSTADIDRIPSFDFREEPSYAVLSRVSIVLLGLVGATVLVAVVALRALQHYPLVG